MNHPQQQESMTTAKQSDWQTRFDEQLNKKEEQT